MSDQPQKTRKAMADYCQCEWRDWCLRWNADCWPCYNAWWEGYQYYEEEAEPDANIHIKILEAQMAALDIMEADNKAKEAKASAKVEAEAKEAKASAKPLETRKRKRNPALLKALNILEVVTD
jgi:hypothetical protein